MIKKLWAHPRVKAVFFGILAIVLGLSLASYSPTDNAWNTASGETYHNWLGPIGSWSADILLQLMGQVAFLVPFALLIFSVFLWIHLNWIKTRSIVLVFALSLSMWLSSVITVSEEYTHWFKAGKGGFIGTYLKSWIPVPTGIWLVLLWICCVVLFIFAFKIPAFKITTLTSKGAWWGIKKLPIHLPEKIKKPFTALHVHHQIQKIKKAVPKAKIKAIKSTTAPIAENKEGMELPSSELLTAPKASSGTQLSKDQMAQLSRSLESVLAEFGVQGQVVGAKPGPVVTLYEFEPASGVKTSRVIALADDVAREMRAVSVRMALVPGSNVIGIEMPNPKREMVYVRELVEDEDFKGHKGALPIILGKDIGGKPVYADLAKMPHLLVAGTTGSGKSVGINTMILSLLYRFTPEQCRLIMVDPKMVELSVYNGIPHLLIPVITEPAKSLMALKWAVHEMEDRYRNMSQLGVRNIEGFNEKLREAKEKNLTLKRRVQTGFDPETGQPIMEEQAFDLTPLPYIVFIIDEMADLMGQCGKEADPLIQRLAQMARAVGIHLILATQRPSVDVVTGTIKSNFPSRISFQVRNKIDSRTILDEQGAEQLLGKGDMLYMPAGNKPTRVHGPFVSDEDVGAVVKHWSEQGEPHYVEAVTADTESAGVMGGGSGASSGDSLYDQAVAIILRDKKPTTSYIQRRLSIGYNKAATLIEKMEQEGVISAPNAAGKREILVPGGE